MGEIRDDAITSASEDGVKDDTERNLPTIASVEGYDNIWLEVTDAGGDISLQNSWEVSSDEFPRPAIA